LDCSGKGEFRNQFVLADLDGTITPLTAMRNTQKAVAWYPVFTHR
jgi:hypothetical protein